LTGLSITPIVAGTYRILFDARFSNSTSAQWYWAIYINGVQNASSVRSIGQAVTGNTGVFTQCIASWTTGPIAVYWYTTGGTLNCYNGGLGLVRIA
jgi:hypothetical protein